MLCILLIYSQSLSFVAFLPILVFFCFRLYTCSVYERSSAICSSFPPENILLAIVFLLISLRVFIRWAVIAGNDRYLERLQNAIFSPTYWIYGALLYLLPTLEFLIEVALFSGFKNAKTWFGFVCDLLATSVKLAEQTLIQLTIAVYLIIFAMYVFVFYRQRHTFQFGWSIFELLLLFCLLVIEQVSKEVLQSC